MIKLVRRILARLSRFRKPPNLSPGPPNLTPDEVRRMAHEHHLKHVRQEFERYVRDRLPLN